MDRTDAAATPLRALLSALGRVGRGIRWYMTTLMGDTAAGVYDRILAGLRDYLSRHDLADIGALIGSLDWPGAAP